ncbi:hypothetical protein P7K49_012322 [Saguinus oedipus]|uniref:Uncharacterized protein n=1 Tax=Saguinus oedipus TaxID=9490 RepID=A0ABQ9VTX2_SAGOE|nr:hypothetical protein P7K49_012322 [Saguinus oedipus]
MTKQPLTLRVTHPTRTPATRALAPVPERPSQAVRTAEAPGWQPAAQYRSSYHEEPSPAAPALLEEAKPEQTLRWAGDALDPEDFRYQARQPPDMACGLPEAGHPRPGPIPQQRGSWVQTYRRQTQAICLPAAAQSSPVDAECLAPGPRIPRDVQEERPSGKAGCALATLMPSEGNSPSPASARCAAANRIRPGCGESG